MKIIKGIILTQPRLTGDRLVFHLRSGQEVLTVVRRKRADQKRDIAFLCVGQQVLIRTSSAGNHVIAENIRIVNYKKRNYLFPIEENEEVYYGDSTVCGTVPRDPDV